MADLRTKYLGLELKNPIIAASSGLTESLDHLKAFEDFGVSAVVLKSLFEEEILREVKDSSEKANFEQFIYPETVDFYEDFNTGQFTAEKYLKLVSDAKSSLSIPVIASINCVSADEWTYFPKVLQNAGADALELNIFILPTDMKRTSADNEKIYLDIIKQIKEKISIPVAVKISPYFSNLYQMLLQFEEAGVDGIVMFNKFFSPDIDVENIKVTNGYVLSSASDIALSLRWTAIMAERLKCDIAATTGITDGSSAVKLILAGAQVVQAASTFYRNGIEYVKTMLSEIEDWMNRKEFNKIDDFRAMMSQDKSNDPAAYERVQFMKYFRAFPHVR